MGIFSSGARIQTGFALVEVCALLSVRIYYDDITET